MTRRPRRSWGVIEEMGPHRDQHGDPPAHWPVDHDRLVRPQAQRHRSSSPRLRAVAAVAVAVLVIGACSRAGEPVAQRIRDSQSPHILRVVYLAQSPFGQMERVHVHLKPETSEAQAVDFWCEVVAPAGGITFDTSVFYSDPPGSQLTSYESSPNYPDCPT